MQLFSEKILRRFIILSLFISCFLSTKDVTNMVLTKQINDNSDVLYQNNLLAINCIGEIKSNIYANNSNTLRLINESSDSDQSSIISNINIRADKVLECLNKYESSNITDEERSMINVFKQQLYTYKATRAKIIYYSNRNMPKEARDEYQKNKIVLNKITEILEALTTYQEKASI